MTSWTATVDWSQENEPTPVELDKIMDRLGDSAAASVVAHPGGWWLLAATVTLEAGTLRQAIAAALQLVEDATGVKATGVEVLSTTEHDRRAVEPSIPDLVGYAEIADLAGVSRQRARQFADVAGFPPAVVETQSGPLRVRSQVEGWLQRRSGKPGRPAKRPAAGA